MAWYGVDIRGRSKTYELITALHQIRRRADTLLDPETIDADEIYKIREALPVFNGPEPKIKNLENRKKKLITYRLVKNAFHKIAERLEYL